MKQNFALLVSMTLACSNVCARPADDLQLMLKEANGNTISEVTFTRYFVPLVWTMINSWLDPEISGGWNKYGNERFKNELSKLLANLSTTCTQRETLQLLNKEIDQVGLNAVSVYSIWSLAIASSMARESKVFDQTIEIAKLVNPSLAKYIDRKFRPTPLSNPIAVSFTPAKSGGQCQIKYGVLQLADEEGYLLKFAEANP